MTQKSNFLKKLLRQPFPSMDEIPWPREDGQEFYSSNRNFKVIYTHRAELSMCFEACLFALFNHSGKLVHQFEPLSCVGKLIWAPDRDVFVVQIVKPFCYLVCNAHNECFSVIRLAKFSTCEVQIEKSSVLKIQYSEEELKKNNSNRVIRGRLTEWPVRKFESSEPKTINLDHLIYHPLSQINQIDEHLCNLPICELNLEKGSFWPFEGKMPHSTVQKYNGRQMEMLHLEAFSEFGDEQSIEWLNEIVILTGGNYSKWETVETYLGKRYKGNKCDGFIKNILFR